MQAIPALFVLSMLVFSTAQADEGAARSTLLDWWPTGRLRTAEGVLQQEYQRRVGLAGLRDSRMQEFEWRRIDLRVSEESTGRSNGWTGIRSVLSATVPTAYFRIDHGQIEQKFCQTVGYNGLRDVRVSECDWRSLAPAEERSPAAATANVEGAIESVLTGWEPTRQVRLRSGMTEQKYSRIVGYDGHRDSRVVQYEWRPIR